MGPVLDELVDSVISEVALDLVNEEEEELGEGKEGEEELQKTPASMMPSATGNPQDEKVVDYDDQRL